MVSLLVRGILTSRGHVLISASLRNLCGHCVTKGLVSCFLNKCSGSAGEQHLVTVLSKPAKQVTAYAGWWSGLAFGCGPGHAVSPR